jgi:hypothetical protein
MYKPRKRCDLIHSGHFFSSLEQYLTHWQSLLSLLLSQGTVTITSLSIQQLAKIAKNYMSNKGPVTQLILIMAHCKRLLLCSTNDVIESVNGLLISRPWA